MIDIQPEIFTAVRNALIAKFGKTFRVYSDNNLSPSEFPCATVVEADNYCYLNSRDTGSVENHVQLMYEINVFSNKISGKKDECREIISVIDDVFLANGFTRMSMTSIPMNDTTKSRMTARYRACVSKDKTIYRR